MNKLSSENDRNTAKRRRRAWLFERTCGGMTWLCVALLAVLIFHVSKEGIAWLDGDFLASFTHYKAELAGIKSALFGTVWLIVATAAISIPIGVAAAIYLEEFARPSRFHTFIEVNVTNLAGVPSIVYGIIGLALFVRGLGLGRSVIAGALTMSLLILPVIITASREAIRAVPPSIRIAAYAIGASRLQTVWSHVLPAALPGVITGVILALSRALGETAPLISIGALTYVASVPGGLGDSFTALPIQIYDWASRPQPEWHGLAAAGIIVLLAVLLLMNATAVFIRQRSQRTARW
jgi:phosphate transport system permease protein